MGFVYLRADNAPFVVGRVLDKGRNYDADGERLKLQWWSPSNEEMRRKASSYSFYDDGRVAFTADIVWKTVEKEKTGVLLT